MIDRMKIIFHTNHPYRMIKEIIEKNIQIYDMDIQNKNMILTINKKDYEIIKKMKTIHHLQIIEYYGKSKIKICLHRYWFLFLMIWIGILLNIVLSNMIFKVEIKTPDYELKKIVKKDLEHFGMKPFSWKVSKKKQETIKEKLLEKEKKKIEWLEIEKIGTKYLVTIEAKKINEEETCPNRNIIAKKNAMITKIEASNGEIIKKKLDYVSKGEVLISGNIYNKEEIVATTCASGQVWGEVWYKVKIEVPQIEIIQTKKNNDFWQFTYKKVVFPKKKGIIKKEYKIGKNLILRKMQETDQSTKKNSFQTIDKEAIVKATKTLEKHLSSKPKIIKKKVLKKSIKNSKIIIEVFLSTEEDITAYQQINNKEG